MRGRNGNSRGVTRRGRKDTAKSDTSNGKETKGTGKGRRDQKEKDQVKKEVSEMSEKRRYTGSSLSE